jgi:hypothetical protein
MRGDIQACVATYVGPGYLALYISVPRLNADSAFHLDKPLTCRDVEEFELALRPHPSEPVRAQPAWSRCEPNTLRCRLNSLSVRRVLLVAGHLSMQMFPVIGSSRFLTETSKRTTDRETGTKGRPHLPEQARKRAEV